MEPPHYNALSNLDFALLTTETLSVSEQLAFSAVFSDILKDDRVDLFFFSIARHCRYSIKSLKTDNSYIVGTMIFFSRFRGNSNQTLLRRFHFSKSVL